MGNSMEALKQAFREQEARKTGNTDFYPIFQALFYKDFENGEKNKIFEIISCNFCPMLGTDIISPGHTVENVAKEIVDMSFAERMILEDHIPLVLDTEQEVFEYLDNTPYKRVTEAIKRFMADYATYDSTKGRYEFVFSFEAMEYEEKRMKYYEDLLS